MNLFPTLRNSGAKVVPIANKIALGKEKSFSLSMHDMTLYMLEYKHLTPRLTLYCGNVPSKVSKVKEFVIFKDIRATKGVNNNCSEVNYSREIGEEQLPNICRTDRH